jgi:chromosome segregation ATPase
MMLFKFSLAAALGLALGVYYFVPAVKQSLPEWPLSPSPVTEVQDALKSRSRDVLKASAVYHQQVNRLKQAEAERSQVQKSKRENLKQMEFLTAEVQKCRPDDAVLTVHNVALRKQDVEGDLEKLVVETEELARREELLNALIARLQGNTTAASPDIAKARQNLLEAETWLNERKSDLALSEVRRWNGSTTDPLSRIIAGEDQLQAAQRNLEQQMIENGVDSTSPKESVRPWKMWSDGHATSAEEIQSRAQQLIARESAKSDHKLAAKPTQD